MPQTRGLADILNWYLKYKDCSLQINFAQVFLHVNQRGLLVHMWDGLGCWLGPKRSKDMTVATESCRQSFKGGKLVEMSILRLASCMNVEDSLRSTGITKKPSQICCSKLTIIAHPVWLKAEIYYVSAVRAITPSERKTTSCQDLPIAFRMGGSKLPRAT